MRFVEEDDVHESEFEVKPEAKDPKTKWIVRIVRSIKRYYKRCPYYDLKTGMCFISYDREDNRCLRDGKYDGCLLLERFLARRYDEITRSGKPLPYDFRDLALV